MEFYVDRRYNNATSIYYGPILFALDIPAKWTQLEYLLNLRKRVYYNFLSTNRYYAFNSSDWQALPLGPWAYAINISDMVCPVLNSNFPNVLVMIEPR